MAQLTYGSLFSGIGGMDLGLDRAGLECQWQVEINEYAQKVLTKHWPDVTRFRDIRDCGRLNLAPVDLIAGGFPCQDISLAGKRAGIEGERSGLWSEFYRVICELQPHYVLVENVPALLNWGIDRVLADLAQSGYDAEWQVLSASQFGAPHLRRRVFIIAYPNNTRGRIQSECKSQCESTSFTGNDGQEANVADSTSRQWYGSGDTRSGRTRLTNSGEMAHATSRRERQCIFPWPSQRAQHFTLQSGWWTVEPDVGRVVDGLSHRVDRLRGLGNAVVPQVAEYLGRCIMKAHERLN